MGLQKLPYCDFVVYTPQETQIQRFMFDENFYTKILFPGMNHFYWDEYLPRVIYQQRGLLRKNEIDPVIFCESSSNSDSFF